MSQSFDYRVFINGLAAAVKERFGLILIESNSGGDQPDYPFLTYTITSPYLPVTTDITDDEQFEMVVSFTYHSRSSLDALNATGSINKFFRSMSTRVDLAKRNIVIVSVSNAGSRDNLISVEYERVAGFDVRFRVKDTYSDTEGIDTINNVEITN